MKRWSVLIIMTLIFLFFITGCGKKGDIRKEVHTEEIVERMIMQIEVDEKNDGIEPVIDGHLNNYKIINLSAKEENHTYIEKLDISNEDLEEGYVITSTNDNSNEIIILKAKDVEKVAHLQKVLENEKENQLATWQTELPEQYKKVEKNIITTNYKYLLYVTYTHPKEIIMIFDECM